MAMLLVRYRKIAVFFAIPAFLLCLLLLGVTPGSATIKKDFVVDPTGSEPLDGPITGDYVTYTTYVGVELRFDANEGNGDNYTWDFGDGFTDTKNKDTQQSDIFNTYIYTYDTENIAGYNVNLTIDKEEDGNKEVDSFNVTLRILPNPVAKFTLTNEDGLAVTPKNEMVAGSIVPVYQFNKGEDIKFVASTSTGYNLEEYEWDLKVESAGFNSFNPPRYGRKMYVSTLTFSYEEDDLYQVMLKVKDENKRSNISEGSYIRISGDSGSDDDAATMDFSFLTTLPVLGGIGVLVVVVFLVYLYQQGYLYLPTGGGSTSSSSESKEKSDEDELKLDGLAKDTSPFAGNKDEIPPPGTAPVAKQGMGAGGKPALSNKNCKRCGGVVPIPSEERPLVVTCRDCGKSYTLAKKKDAGAPGTPPGDMPFFGGEDQDTGVQRISAEGWSEADKAKALKMKEAAAGSSAGSSSALGEGGFPLGGAAAKPAPAARSQSQEKKPVAVKKCAQCGGRVPVYSNKRPLTVSCPKCGKVYNLGAKKAAGGQRKAATRARSPSAGGRAGGGVETQDITFCPSCGSPNPIRAGTASVTCSTCSFNFRV